jgi:hypothetical protein
VEWVDPLGLQESQPNIEEQKKVALAIGKRAAACLCLKDSNSCISEDKISAGYPGIIAKLRRKNPTGETSIFGGITVNPDFYAFDAATATEEQVTDALHSMRHEIYHSKDSFFGRIRANSNDDYHNNIDDKAYWFVQENKQELMRCMRGE